MTGVQEQLGIYLHLAQASERRQRPLVRDKFLVLAAECASELALDQIADFCRKRILENNPGHLLRKYPTYALAMLDENFHTYLKQLHRAYPLEKAEFMLTSLGIDPANERAAYFSDHEYAASLLGTNTEELDKLFSGVPAAASSAPAKPSLNLDSALDEPKEGFDLFEFQASQSDEYSRSNFQDLLKAADEGRPVPGITPGAPPASYSNGDAESAIDDDDDMEDDEESRQATAEAEAELKTGIKPPGSNGHASPAAPVEPPAAEPGPTAGVSPARQGQPLKDDPRAKPGLNFDELSLGGPFAPQPGKGMGLGLGGSAQEMVFSEEDSSESTLGPADMAAIIGKNKGDQQRLGEHTDDEPSVDASISALASDLVSDDLMNSGSSDMTVQPRMPDAPADDMPPAVGTGPASAQARAAAAGDALSALRALAADPFDDSMDGPLADVMPEGLAVEIRPSTPVALGCESDEAPHVEEPQARAETPDVEPPQAEVAEPPAAERTAAQPAEEPAPVEAPVAAAESPAVELELPSPVAEMPTLELPPLELPALELPRVESPTAPEPEEEVVPLEAVSEPLPVMALDELGPTEKAQAPAAEPMLESEPAVDTRPARAQKPDMDADIFSAPPVQREEPAPPAPPAAKASDSDDAFAPQKRKPRRNLPPVVFTADSVDLELGITEVELPPPEPEPEDDPNVLFADLAEHKAKPSDSFVGTTLGLFQATEFKHRPRPEPSPPPPTTPPASQQPVTSFPAYLPQTEPKYLPPQPSAALPAAPLPPPVAPVSPPPPAYLPVQHTPAPQTPAAQAPAPPPQSRSMESEDVRSPLRTPVAHVAPVTPAIVFVGGLPANMPTPEPEDALPPQDDGTIELESDDGEDEGDNVIAASHAMALRGELAPEDARFDEEAALEESAAPAEKRHSLRETPTYTPESPAAKAIASLRSESALVDDPSADIHSEPDSEETASAIVQAPAPTPAAQPAVAEPAARIEPPKPPEPKPEPPARPQNVSQLADALRPNSPEWTPSHMAEPAPAQQFPWLLAALALGVVVMGFVVVAIMMAGR